VASQDVRDSDTDLCVSSVARPANSP
jgi:hypothetical protein